MIAIRIGFILMAAGVRTRGPYTCTGCEDALTIPTPGVHDGFRRDQDAEAVADAGAGSTTEPDATTRFDGAVVEHDVGISRPDATSPVPDADVADVMVPDAGERDVPDADVPDASSADPCRDAFDGTACGPGDPCSTRWICIDGACTPIAAPYCDDGNACTDDFCVGDECLSFADDANLCDDGDACTIGDTCSRGTCVAGSTRDGLAFAGSCYQYFSVPLEWASAEAACVTLAGHLACVTSTDEQDFLATSFYPFGTAWLGGHRVDEAWRWTTGETWFYENWDTGQPNGGPGEDYLIMWSPRWHDIQVDGLGLGEPYICEWR